MGEDLPDKKHGDDTGFRVVDRRLFTAEGELRKEVLAEKTAEEQRPAPTAGSKLNPSPATAAPPAPAPTAPAETPQPLRSFQLLIDFLARNALLYMGGMADPRTGQPLVDLEGAREMLDLLDALREKTRGNLAPEEDKLLLEVIGSLKLSFVEVSQAASKARREKAPGKS